MDLTCGTMSYIAPEVLKHKVWLRRTIPDTYCYYVKYSYSLDLIIIFSVWCGMLCPVIVGIREGGGHVVCGRNPLSPDLWQGNDDLMYPIQKTLYTT